MFYILKVESLVKRFHLALTRDIDVCALDGVSFEVPQGRFLGISGPSGVGKSTILKCIYRTYLPTSGHVWYRSALFGEIDLANASERQISLLRAQEIGYVSQFLKVIPRVTAIDVVAGRLIPFDYTWQQARQRAQLLLEMLHVPKDLWDAYPATFSGGEQQRINLARGFITRPRLLLLDEPTASLDDGMKQHVVELILKMKQEGVTMVGIFHDQDTMKRVADSVLNMGDVIARNDIAKRAEAMS